VSKSWFSGGKFSPQHRNLLCNLGELLWKLSSKVIRECAQGNIVVALGRHLGWHSEKKWAVDNMQALPMLDCDHLVEIDCSIPVL
jgi:hypothetical protein